MASKIPGSDISHIFCIANSNPETICLIPVSQEEVSKIMLVLKDSSAGWDIIYNKKMKQTYQHILPMLTHLFNLSITKDSVPKELNIGKVFPIYKKINCMLVNNFRPVSVLPLSSKILERLMYFRILGFFNKHNLFYKYQFGFRERHGTDIALIVLIDKIMSALNEGDYVLGVFLGLSKAFDKLHMTGSRVILRRESNTCHSTNMIPAPWTSSVEFSRVSYWYHYYSLYMSMIAPMFHLYYLHYCLQMIPMSLTPGKIYQIYLQQ